MKHSMTRLLGDRASHKEDFYVAVAMCAVTALYEIASSHIAPDYSFNMYEFVGTWSGLVCVWLSRTRNILCWPWGILSSVALGFFFADIGLPGQEWLNWGYFTAVQIWSWPYWAFGGADYEELPVTMLSWIERILYLAIIASFTAIVFALIQYFSPGSFHPILDSLVVAASVVAQFLLGKKKLESWFLWLGPVNMLSIYLFFAAAAYTLTALYVAFFIHALFAINSWRVARLSVVT